MSEQERDKAGLHKKISSIFKGVPIPHTDDGQELSGTPVPEHTSYTEPKPPATESQQISDAPVPESADYNEPKAPAPESQQISDAPVPESADYNEPKVPAPESQQISDAPVPESADYNEPKPPATESQQISEAPVPESADYNEPKAPAPESQQSCEPSTPAERTDYTEPKTPTVEQQSIAGPKNFQPMDSSIKIAPLQQPEDDIVEPLPEVATDQKPKDNIDNIIEHNLSQKSANVVTIESRNFWQQITDKLFTPKPGVSATRQKVMVVMVPIFFIALIFIIRQVFGTNARKTEAAVESNVPGVAAVDSKSKVDWEIPPPYPTTLRDPEQLGHVETEQNEIETRELIKLDVKSVLYSEDNPSAVIGSKIVHEGEKIRDVTIVKINRDSVEFEMNGKKWTQKVRR